MKPLVLGLSLLVMLASFAYYTSMRFSVLEQHVCQLEHELKAERALNKRLVHRIDGWEIYR